MLRPITEIKFEQRTQLEGQPPRSLVFTFNFVHEFSATNTWVDMTNQCKITFPKNIYVRDANNKLLPLGGTQASKLIRDVFLRGDKLTVSYGYWLDNGDRSVTQVFSGYISKVTSKKPIQLECEDSVWLLKQIPCKRQVWPANKTVQQLLQSLLVGTPFTVRLLDPVTIGNFIVENETVAQLLARLRKEYHLEAFFGGPTNTELRIGLSPYIQSEAILHYFAFQNNIISDELDWQRKDDIKLSAVVQSINTVEGGVNKKGETKTKKERLTILVWADINGNFQYITKQKGVDLPANVEGERRTLFYPNITSAAKLYELGVAELKKYYYSGFKGKFTTFAYPLVKLGDHVNISDRLMPDRNGTYVVRGVEYTGGVNGHRQIIMLDYKLTT